VIRCDGTLERDYMYVSDAVDAYMTLSRNIGRPDVRGEAFNFGWGKGYSVLEIVREILVHADTPLEPRILGQNRGEIARQWLASEKAERLLGWRPRVELAEGIARSVRWYRSWLRSDGAVPEAYAAVAANGAVHA
jgi:CDP-glucose 4,6-dehydratase